MPYYIKQHISQLVAGHYEATYEGQNNSSDAIISMMEVKRVFVSWIYRFLTFINMERTNEKTVAKCILGNCKVKSRQCWSAVALALVMGHLCKISHIVTLAFSCLLEQPFLALLNAVF